MHDAASGRHPVYFAGPDRLYAAQAVAMHDFSRKEVSDGRQPYVRVGTHVQSMAGGKNGRSHLIQKYKWPDHASLDAGQCAPHCKVVAQVARRRYHDNLQRTRLPAIFSHD